MASRCTKTGEPYSTHHLEINSSFQPLSFPSEICCSPNHPRSSFARNSLILRYGSEPAANHQRTINEGEAKELIFCTFSTPKKTVQKWYKKYRLLHLFNPKTPSFIKEKCLFRPSKCSKSELKNDPPCDKSVFVFRTRLIENDSRYTIIIDI